MIPSVVPFSVTEFVPEGKLVLHERVFDDRTVDQWFADARRLAWRREEIVMFGKRILAPRETLWRGDAGACYRYSGVERVAAGWGALDDVRRAVEAQTRRTFNFALGTRYASGHDTLGWHSDDERDLGVDPTIGVLSLGSSRDFQFRPKRGGPATTVSLSHGSLLVMQGDFQEQFQHRVPRRLRSEGERFSFSFRHTLSRRA